MIAVRKFSFRLYGLIIGLGIMIGFWVAGQMARLFKKRTTNYSLNTNDVWDGLWWVIIPGIVLARIYHVIGLWDYYSSNILLIPQIWSGGVGIFGAITGGMLGLLFYTRKKRKNILELIDLAAFGIPVGQAIGRWGNYFNQELYGKATELPWGITIRAENNAEVLKKITKFHPLFLYESIWSIVTFGILFWIFKLNKAKLKPGSYFFIYLIFYGFGRFWLEFLKIESWRIGGINIAQVMSLAFILTGFIFLKGLMYRSR